MAPRPRAPSRRGGTRPVLAAFFFLLPSCAFLLDFDELQEGGATGGTSSTGGTPGSAGAGGAAAGEGGNAEPGAGAGGSDAGAGGSGAGEAGAAGAACDLDCDDSDPCTLDRCVLTEDGPECERTPLEGLVPDGLDETIAGGRIPQVTVAAGPDAFYLSAFDAGADDGPELTFYRVGTEGDSVELMSRISELTDTTLAGDPVSAAALVVDASQGLRIHAYLGLLRETGTSARPWRFVFDGRFDVVTQAPVGESFAVSAPHLPAAAEIGDAIWGAWIQEDGTIGLHSRGTEEPDFTLGSPDAPAAALSLISGLDPTLGTPEVPAVLYASHTNGVFAWTEAGGVQSVTECLPDPGLYSRTFGVRTSVDGVWLAGWTKVTSEVLAAEVRAIVCTNTEYGCLTPPSERCAPSGLLEYARNPAFADVDLPGDAAGVRYYVWVVPGIDADGLAMLGAQLVRADFGEDPSTSETVFTAIPSSDDPDEPPEPLLLSAMPTSAEIEFRGPDLPATAIVAPDKALIAWVEPRDAQATSDVLRVRRFQMCIPD